MSWDQIILALSLWTLSALGLVCLSAALRERRKRLTDVGVGAHPQNPPLGILQASDLDHEGIVVGEVEGWRVWRVGLTKMTTPHGEFHSQPYRLLSLFQSDVWPEDGLHAHKVDVPIGKGIHVFRDWRDAVEYTTSVAMDRAIKAFQPQPEYNCGMVIGRCAMWGELIEFERGYHAEWAKPISLQALFVTTRNPGPGYEPVQKLLVGVGSRDDLTLAMTQDDPILDQLREVYCGTTE